MRTTFDAHLFAACLRTRRGEQSLRDVAMGLEISPATLHRLEHEQIQPDLQTFLQLCEWLRLSHRTFMYHEQTPPIVELVEHALQADQVLSRQQVDAFMLLYHMIRAREVPYI